MKEVKPKDIADRARTFISVATGIVALLGIWSEAKGIRIAGIESDDWTRAIRAAAFGLYLIAWTKGTFIDLKAHEEAISALAAPPQRLYKLLGACSTLVVLFVLMWLLRARFDLLFAVLFLFLVGDAWLSRIYYRKNLRREFSLALKTRLEKKEYLDALDTEFVDEYARGSWRKWRYGFGFGWILLVEGAIVSGAIDRVANLHAGLSPNLLLALCLFLYVLGMEAAMWTFRMWMIVRRRSLRKLPFGYQVVRDDG